MTYCLLTASPTVLVFYDRVMSLPSIRQGIETGLTPNLNQMSVMGLVSIPGMLTGQILAGTSPLVAAKYQIVIMFFICSNSMTILLSTLCQAYI